MLQSLGASSFLTILVQIWKVLAHMSVEVVISHFDKPAPQYTQLDHHSISVFAISTNHQFAVPFFVTTT
jgi:hypothetical protein